MNKRINSWLSWLLVFSMVLSMTVTTVFAAEGNAFQSTATQVSGDKSFTVTFTQPTTLTVSALTLRIGFDNNVFEITEIATGIYLFYL